MQPASEMSSTYAYYLFTLMDYACLLKNTIERTKPFRIKTTTYDERSISCPFIALRNLLLYIP